MPLRAPKMNGFIFGFQRLVWCPKWTPASRSCFIEMALPWDWRAALIASGAGAPGSARLRQVAAVAYPCVLLRLVSATLRDAAAARSPPRRVEDISTG